MQFKTNVGKRKTSSGAYGVIQSKHLRKFIGKRVMVIVREIREIVKENDSDE